LLGDVQSGVSEAYDASHRSVVDDGAVALSQHDFAYVFHAPEDTTHIGVEDGLVSLVSLLTKGENAPSVPALLNAMSRRP
jgi:hypothetical protein